MTTTAQARPTTRAVLPYAVAFGIVALGLSAIFVRWANVPGAVSGFYRIGIAAANISLPVHTTERRGPAHRRWQSDRHVVDANHG